MVNEACHIFGYAENSVLFDQVIIEPGAKVYNSVLLPGTHIKKNAELYNCVVNEKMVIEEGTKIGTPNDEKVYLVSQEGILEE